MEEHIRVRTGTIIGREHAKFAKNNQDAYKVKTVNSAVKSFTIAVVCDGCGSSSKSEVGASLAVNFLTEEFAGMALLNLPQSVISQVVYLRLIDWLKQLLALSGAKDEAAKVSFIREYLLFTVIAAVVDTKEALIFAAGDGVLFVNNTFISLDKANTPPYPAYHLLSSSRGSGFSIPDNFEYFTFYRRPRSSWWSKTEKLERLAIGTDSWLTHPDLFYENVWALPHPKGLQRKMNVWSVRQKFFSDDATLVTFEYVAESEGGL